jgi:hypothetical protein
MVRRLELIIDQGICVLFTTCYTRNLRYDPERVLPGAGHPADRYTNYQIQAERGALNSHLHRLAANANGQHGVLRTQGTFDGSTVGSVNLQPPPPGRNLNLKRVVNTLEYSNRYG